MLEFEGLLTPSRACVSNDLAGVSSGLRRLSGRVPLQHMPHSRIMQVQTQTRTEKRHPDRHSCEDAIPTARAHTHAHRRVEKRGSETTSRRHAPATGNKAHVRCGRIVGEQGVSVRAASRWRVAPSTSAQTLDKPLAWRKIKTR